MSRRGVGLLADLTGPGAWIRTRSEGPREAEGPGGPREWPDEGPDKEKDVDNEAAFDKFRECAVEVLQVPAEKVTMDARFAEDLDADSLDLVELVMALEEAFDITVEESELEDIETAGQAFELISSKL
jgi:acyl carrier protein